MDNSKEDLQIDDHILIVEDQDDNLAVLKYILLSKGFKVRHVTTGELALQSVQEKHPDLILLDIRMPEMDGFEVCQRLKSDDRTSSIPVIFTSALVDESSRMKGFQVGGLDYIDKPFYPRELIKRVKNHLAVRQMQLQEENRLK
jgi:DNA-binding response OmpR family regulator